MKLLLSILTCVILFPAFGQIDSVKLKLQRDSIKKIFVDNKFKETKVMKDVPLEVLKKANVESYEDIDGRMTKLNWAAKSKTGIWVLSITRAGCGSWTENYIIDKDVVKTVNYGNELTTFKEVRKWCLGKQEPVMF